MVFVKLCAVLWVTSSVAFAEELPQPVKYFSDWIPDLNYNPTNECCVVRYDPSAYSHAYVHSSNYQEKQEIQPGEYYSLTRGERAHFTQHAGVGCTLTYTNGMSELNGVALPIEFKDSPWQLLISGRVASRQARDVFEKYAFVVNAAGEAYDVSTRTKFHFGLPFHAPEVKTSLKIDPGIENIQRAFLEEGAKVYKNAFDELSLQAMNDVAKESVTNAVVITVQVGGADAINEDVRRRLLESDPKYARLLRMVEESKRQYVCVLFCTRETRDVRIVAVARVGDGLKCRMWWYEGVSGNPSLIYSRDCQKSTGSYYEYGDAGDLRNLCLFKDGVNTSYHTIKDGVLQKSSDMEKAQAFISKVEEMFARYIELDTTGTLRAFVETLNSKPTPGK